MTSEDKIRKADDTLFAIFHDFNIFDYLTPLNARSEEEQFFRFWDSGQTYNPRFQYPLLPPKLPEWKRKVEALELGDSPLEVMFNQLKSEWLRRFELVEKRGTPGLTTTSIKLFGQPDDFLVQEARQILKDTENEIDDTINVGVKGLGEEMRERLRKERIEGWDVLEDPASIPLARVDAAHHKIRIKTGMIVTTAMLKRLLHHEIEVHVYRAANGERQPYKAFRMGFDRNLETEEGLAVVLEDRLGISVPNVKRRYAGRVLAANLVPTKSFFDIVNALVEFFAPDEAFTLALRSKRGQEDTSQPGGFVQDHIYLQGRKQVASLSNADIRLLYSGRIAVHHLDMVKELIAQKKLVDPAFVPDVFHG